MTKRTWLIRKGGWPVERIKGRPVLNFFRILIHARWYGEFVDKTRVSMTIRLDGLTLPQAAALRAMFERMRQLGGLGGSRWVAFYSDGDGNFRPRPIYEFSHSAETIEDWSAGECQWDSNRDEYGVDFDSIAWGHHNDGPTTPGRDT